MGNVFPAGISLAFFETYPFCTGAVGSSPECQPQHLTPGNLNVPGGFGWLKFGAVGQCAGFGLGMSTDMPDVTTTSRSSRRRSARHRTASAAAPLSPAIRTSIASAACPATRPAQIAPTTSTTRSWSRSRSGITPGARGQRLVPNIGFAGFQLTECEGGKNVSGVWRKQFFLGPTTGSSPGEFASLAVQLVR